MKGKLVNDVHALKCNELRGFYDAKYDRQTYMGGRYSYWSHSGVQPERIMDTITRVSASPATVLDYGCGNGAWIDVLSGAFPDASISGLEISEVAIKQAASRFPQCSFQVFEGGRAPYGNDNFDLIYSYHVLEHVVDLNGTIAEFARILKPGGLACVVLPCGNCGSLEDWVMRRIRNGIRQAEDGRIHFYEPEIGHLRRLASDRLIQRFQANGFLPKSVKFGNHFVGWIDWLVRGHDPVTIGMMCNVPEAVHRRAQFQLLFLRKFLVLLNRMVWPATDQASRNSLSAGLVKIFGRLTDRSLRLLSSLEWRLLNHRPNGAEQFLVFQLEPTTSGKAEGLR